MKLSKKHKILIVIMLFVALSCGLLYLALRAEFQGGEVKNVLLLHSLDEANEGYVEYNKEIKKTFEEHGIKVDIRHFYVGFNKGYDYAERTLANYHDSARLSKWHPDVIISDGDGTLDNVFMENTDSDLARRSGYMKVIACGTHYPNWDVARYHSNIVILTDYLEYVPNLIMAHEISQKNVIEIETGDRHIDDKILGDIRKSIQRPPFINLDEWPGRITTEMLNTTLRDSILVCGTLRDSLRKSVSVPALPCKLKFVSNEKDTAVNEMVFTPMRECFNNNHDNVLAGYLCTYKTIARDAATYAAMVLKGTDISELKSHEHEKKYVMNYDVMKRFGLKYEDYSDQFEIVNAPFRVVHPDLYIMLIVGIVLLSMGIISSFVILAMRIREYRKQNIYKLLHESAELSEEALRAADGRLINSEEDLEKLLEGISEEYKADADELRSLLFVEGTHVKSLRLPIHSMQYDEEDRRDNGHEWWQAIINVEKKSNGLFSINGILININSSKRREENLKTLEQIALETKKKEDFLMNVSHEIRTPLNAIMGFCDILSMTQYDELSADDHAMMSSAILSNNYSLTKIITDILLFSKIETNTIEYLYEDIDAARFMIDVFKQCTGKQFESHKMKLVIGRDKVLIHADKYRLRDILNQYISNAMKFSEPGSEVRIGWQYHLNSHTMELYVEDDGLGISIEKQGALFGLFWKDSEFVPGIGIGLNIARNLAEAMGGKVRIDSRPGIGSRFCVTFEKVGECDPLHKDSFIENDHITER